MKTDMKKQILFLLACMALFLTSCSTMRKSTASSMMVESGIYQYPTVADLNVKEKVERQVTWPYRFFKFNEPSLATRKANLMADILKENNADILLEPQVTFIKRPFGARKLTITGYPAVFKNFRKATEQDLKALQVVIPAPEMKVYQVSEPWYKRIFKKKDK